MAKKSIDVDQVVREVLAELDHAPNAGHTDNELVINARVVTLSEVEGRLGPVRRLVVPPQAVVTPAVRDELYRKNITLAYATTAKPQAAGSLRLVLVTAGKRFDPAALVHALGKEDIQVEQHASDCLIAAADQLAAELRKANTLGVLLTRHTAAGLCLANRHRGVRAVSGADAPAVANAAAAVGANLLVLDPGVVGFFQLKQIVTEFCRSGTRECPEVYQEQLG